MNTGHRHKGDARQPSGMGKPVDVAINYYGKPFHTLVTIGTLLQHSGQHIGKVYLIKEPQQPDGGDLIIELLARHDWNVEVFVPALYLGWTLYERKRLSMLRRSFRWSLRYQYALERTDRPYLFLTHNDVLFEGDAIAPLVQMLRDGGHAAVGDMGACWKCAANAAGLCTNRRPDRLSMSYADAVRIHEEHPSPGRITNLELLDKRNPIPFPECRLNEWFTLIDVASYRREVIPRGTTDPIGTSYLGDTGIAWFRSMFHKGYTFSHAEGPYKHCWTIDRTGGGHEANLDRQLYDHEEAIARSYYEATFI